MAWTCLRPRSGENRGGESPRWYGRSESALGCFLLSPVMGDRRANRDILESRRVSHVRWWKVYKGLDCWRVMWEGA